ncbi:MAG: hypothetical protein IT215_00975 [Chitinophagaceae bacterium]|nr:hypothetical protein [Chitinophagaceae bacterium]HMN32838.1 hypothetical protein [Chitinophagaceae bacterium]
MTQELEEILPNDFAETSRVWIFQSNRPFNEKEEVEINEQLYNFYVQWKSHGDEVKGWAKLLFKQFIVVLADVQPGQMGGCSTDSMTRVIQSFERQYQVNLFDRLSITFLVDGKPQPLPMEQVKYALEQGYIETDTLLFNNLVDSKEKLKNEWLVPLNKSWLWNKVVN